MTNPYLIQGPAQISFSGGRSSAMMLCKIVEAHGGTLPDDVIVQFANTGKEREETLVFIERVTAHLGVKCHWIEYAPNGEQFKMGATANDRWKLVDYIAASRNGEPFEETIKRSGMPPTVVFRQCTAYLKSKPMAGHMKSLGFSTFVTVAGIRSDEPRRVSKMRNRLDFIFVVPLSDAGVTAADVVAFWKAMPFDLDLASVNNETVSGNCDLCFLKSTRKLLHLIREEPSRADWWIKQEASGKLFRIDRPNYAALKIIAMQPQLFDAEEAEDAQPCECTD
jgi:3'-phosphoadenosine 5'-phosphosulfate sulfotransferase (PAPS reductase)/FAD synthetase